MMCTPTQDVWQPAGCVSRELVCVCVSLVRVVIICLASTHTALVSSPSLTVLHLTTYIQSQKTPFLRRARAASLKAKGSRFGALAEEEYDKIAPVIACMHAARTHGLHTRKKERGARRRGDE